MTYSERRRVWTRILGPCALLALGATTGGCGASPAPSARAPSAPPADSAPAVGAPAYGQMQPSATMAAPPQASFPPPAGAPTPPPAAAPVAPPPPEAAEVPTSMTDQVYADLKRAEHQVAAGDCPTACRALGSMERAVVFLCSAKQTADDEDRCANARRRLLAARRRIRTTCGACAGGPSVEPDAPIPSTGR
jgi:hypothetical protein